MLNRIADLYGLSVVHARSMVKAAAFFFSFVAGVTTFKSATNALFLSRSDPTQLPYLYLATALVVTVVTIGLGRQLSKYPAKPVLRGSVLISSGLLFGLSVLAAFDVRQILGVLYVAGEVYATAISVLFWARLGEVFDVRSAKRVFGVIAAAGMAGAVLGGVSVNLLAGIMPAVGWCLFAAISLIVVRPLLGRGQGGAPKVRRKRLSLLDGYAYAAKDRYPRGVAILVVLLAMQTAAVDYAFRTGAVLSVAGDEAALTSLFGSLNAVVGVGAILFQTTVTRPLLSRLGVFAFLAVVPALTLVSSGAYALWPLSFMPIFLLKTFEMMGSLSLNQPALGLLYNPMPADMRDSVRALVDGAVKKLGGAVGGVLLLLFGASLDPEMLISLVAGLAVVILLWVRVLRPGYLAALEVKLGARLGKSAVIDTSDRATREQLLGMLKDPDGGKVLAALSALERNPRIHLVEHVADLLAHPSERVRSRAIEYISKYPNPEHAPLLEAVIGQDARRPTAEAARALALVAPQRAKLVLEPYLLGGDHDLGLVCACIEALLPRGGAGAGSPVAEKKLEEMFSHGRRGPAAERREVVRLLGHMGPSPMAWRLATYLDDPDPSVSVLAVEAAAHAQDEALPPKLLHRLLDRRIRGRVIDALASYGDSVVPLLVQNLNDRRLPPSLRAQLPKVLRRIGSKTAVDGMLFSNVRDDAFVRFTIVTELARLRRANPQAKLFDRARVTQAALRRLTAYAHYRPIAMDLAVGGANYGLLLRAVEDRVTQNLQGALRLLGLIYDREALDGALLGLQGGAYADALELLDVALEGSGVRAEVLARLETSAPSAVSTRAQFRAFALVESRDVQLAAIAHFTLSRLGEAPPDVREPTQGEPLMPKSLVERVFVLEAVQLFHNLPIDDLTAVAELCIEGHAEPRAVIYEENEPGESMFVIVSGEVHLTRRQERLLDLSTGDSFGQVSILDGGRRPVTATAGDEGVQYLILERAPFMDLIMDRPEVVTGLFAVLARRLRELVQMSGGTTGGGQVPPTPLSGLPGPAPSLTPQVRTIDRGKR